MRRIILLVLAVLALPLPSYAAPLPRTGTFHYSSLCWSPLSGDASGYRVRLVRTTREDRLYLEWSEGPLYGPMLATELKLDPASERISFVIPSRNLLSAQSYSGTITAERMVLDSHVVPRRKMVEAIRDCA